MDIIELLPRSGNFYKVNLHTHSTLSDGNFTPLELKDLYLSNGYDAIAFTDHRKCIPHPDLTDEKFLAITGTELDFSQKDENGKLLKAVHLNAFACDPLKSSEYVSMPLDYELINRMIELLKNDNFFVVLNHPVWSNMSSEEIEKIHGFDAMEINNSIAVMFNNFSDDSALYEYFLRAGGRALPIAADDSHKIFDDGSPFVEYAQSFVMVKTDELSYQAVMKAISSGSCYSSTGPQFENLWLEGDLLHIECSPVFGVFVHSKFLDVKTQAVEKTDCITHVDLDISEIRKVWPYFWVQLRDTKGGKAWATPFWFE